MIIFVDDDNTCHTLFSMFVLSSDIDMKILGAYSAEEALSLAKDNLKDLKLIVSDILLPDMSGIELFEAIKLDSKLNEIPFIFQSGLSSSEQVVQKIIEEGTKIVYKPYKQQDLIQSIAEAI